METSDKAGHRPAGALVFAVALSLAFAHGAIAQVELDNIGSAPLPSGSGARALGQGNAFTAVADDATAASWNPAGLIQLERPELSAVGLYFPMIYDFSPGGDFSALGDQRTSRTDLNYLSAVFPFDLGDRRIVTSLNYQQMYDLNFNLDVVASTSVGPLTSTSYIDFAQKGGIAALTPAVAAELFPNVAIGVSANFYVDQCLRENAWTKTIDVRETGTIGMSPFTSMTDWKEDFNNVQGLNFNIGLLARLYEREDQMLTLGLNVETPFTLEFDRNLRSTTELTVGALTTVSNERSRRHLMLHSPLGITGGLAWQQSDHLTLAMDVEWRDYSRFLAEDENGNRYRPIGTAPEDAPIQDTYAVRMGCEYLLYRKNCVVPLRAGFLWEQRPSIGPPDNVFGVTVGIGLVLEQWSFDLAYQYKWANNLDGRDVGLPGASFDLREHPLFFSVIYRF